MKNIVNFYVEKFKTDHRKARRMASLLLTLALVVTLGVFWQLHATGIALTNETYCGLEEHEHTEDCYESVLVCGLEESEGHTHTEACFEEQLVCDLEEHTHAISCMSDETADVETASDWEKTLPDLTGVWAEDVVGIAESQLGYTESTKNFILDEDGETRRGYTRYGAWAGNEYGDWDAMFASFCLYYAGVDREDFPEATGAYAWSVKLEKENLYADAADCDPVAGNLVFFDTDKDEKIDRVGVITAVDEKKGKLTVIEGDSNDAVEENTYSVSASEIMGYGVLPEQELETSEADAAVETAETAETGGGITVKAANAATDLEEYFDEVNASGGKASITLELRTVDNTEITDTDEEGNLVITTNTTYHLALTIHSTVGFEAGTYTYTLPDGFNVESGSGKIVSTSGEELGTWSVGSDGILTLEFDDVAGSHQDVSVTLTANVKVKGTNTSIQIGNQEYYIRENTDLEVNKSGSNYLYENGNCVERMWEVEFSQSGVVLSETTMYDVATDTSSNPLYNYLNGTSDTVSYNNQHFDTGKPLEITVTLADGTTYTWTVEWSSRDLTLYTLDNNGNLVTTTNTSDRIVGYIYNFPQSVKATCSDSSTVTLDLTQTETWENNYQVTTTGYTIYDVQPTTARVYYYNTVYVDNGVDNGYANNYGSQDVGTFSMIKTWERGDDNVSVNWTVTATIAAGTVTTYELVDTMTVRTQENEVEETAKFNEYSDDVKITITVPQNTTINGEAVTAGDYTVYKAVERIDNEYTYYNVPDDAVFVYLYDQNTAGEGFFVLGMKCCCDEAICTSWSSADVCEAYICKNASGEMYCACWQLDQEVTVTLTYATPKEKMVSLLNKYGYSGDVLYNSARLNYGQYYGLYRVPSASLVASYSTYVGLAMAHKTLTQEANTQNNYTASYEAVINSEHYLLTENDGDLIITDTLSSSLTFLPSSLIILATDENGYTTTLTSNDYTYNYDSNTHVITIRIKDPGTNSYTITYDAQILSPDSDTQYSNSLALSWLGDDITVSTDTTKLSEVTTSSTTYIVTILKTDATTNAVLKGAEFGLYEADTGTLKATDTTDDDGLIAFQTVSGTGTGALTFETHKLYYLMETNPPDGYTLDTTKYYFYFCDSSDSDNCSECKRMSLPAGVTSSSVKKLTDNSGFFTITNTQTKYGFTVKKVSSKDSTTLTGAEFYLYYQSAVLDAYGKETGEYHKYYAILDVSNAVTGWNSSTEQATKFCLTDGTFSVSGLPAGTYYLEEVTAPNGYNLLSESIKIEIASNGKIEVTSNSASVNTENDVTTITVENTPGRELPETGGTGTWMYGLTGLVLCGGAGLALARRRRVQA